MINQGTPNSISSSGTDHCPTPSGEARTQIPEAGGIPPQSGRNMAGTSNTNEAENFAPSEIFSGTASGPADRGPQSIAATLLQLPTQNPEKNSSNFRRPEILSGSHPPCRPLRDQPQSQDRRGESAAGMDLQPLREALPMADLCGRGGVVLRRGAGGLVASCPFHEETTPSFTIHDRDPHSAHCYGCGWHGDIFRFWSDRHGLPLSGKGFAEVVRQLSSLCGIMPPPSDVRFSAIPPDRKAPPSILEQEPPRLPELTPLLPAHAEALIRLRGYDAAGLREAARRGYLHCCDWPLDADGRPGSRSSASWCITDSARRVAQFRRLDGELYFAGKDREGIKAWSTRGVRWLVGCQDVKPETELVLLVEGGADFLAAWTLISRHAAALSPVPSLAVCCIFGASISIAPECRAMLAGKRVRIVMDVDAPRTVKRKGKEIQARPGTEAAARWSTELTGAGAVVDVYSLEGLSCRKNGEERPVGDLNDLLLMEDAELSAAIALQLLSPDPASPLPRESTLRTGAALRAHPDAAAGFVSGVVPTPARPFSMTSAPAPPLPPSVTASAVPPPAPGLSTEDLIEKNRRAAVERIRQKLAAGMHLSRAEIATLREDERLRAAASQLPPGEDGENDPVTAVCESLNVWWVNGGGGVFQVGNGHQWREMPREDVCAMLQEQGISGKLVGTSLLEQNRRCMLHIMDRRVLDRAIDGLAGFRPGIHDFKTVRILVRKGPLIIEPKEGDSSVIEALLMGALGLDGVEGAASMVQYERFNYWLARAARNIHQPGESHLNSQIMMLAGPAGAGKSLLQHFIITAALGGRNNDPSRYLFGETSFNEGWVGSEHLLIEDPRPNVRTHDRLLFAQMLKALAVNQEHSLHANGKAEFTVPSRFAVSISINDDPDSLRILPKLTPDFLDKVMLLKVRHWPLPMPAETPGDRAALRARITEEMPAFLHHILSLEVPDHLKDPRQRFGVLHYQNPDLAMLLSEDTPGNELLQLLDHTVIRPESATGPDKSLWEEDGAHDAEEYLARHPRLSQAGPLQLLSKCAEFKKRVWMGTAQQLSDTLERCASARIWRKIIENNQLSRLLLRLEQDRPDRVCSHHTRPEGANSTHSKQRFWIIAAADATSGG